MEALALWVGHALRPTTAFADHSKQLTNAQTTMSTRSRIGLLLEDNSVLSVYHHWDGYPGGLGAFLVANYNTKEKVAELIDGGDISTVMSRRTWDGAETNKEIVLYYAERGDTGVEPVVADDDWEFISQTADCGGEYAYVFNPVTSQWLCYDRLGGEYVNLYSKEPALV